MLKNSIESELVQALKRQSKWLAIVATILFLGLGGLAVYVFQLQQMLTKETAKSAQLTQELTATRNSLAAETAQKTRLTAELNSTQGKLTDELSRKSPLPIRLSYRKSMVGEGLVAIFRNTSAQHLSVLATFVNPQLGATSSSRLELPPDRDVNFGHLEGWRFNPGDEITLVNNEFEPLKATASLP